MSRTLVAGVDSSTQSTKVIVCDADTGEVVREGRAPHPEGTEVDPRAWWRAFTDATTGGLLDGVHAIAVGAQQHGLITLDGDGQVVRPALLWNDTRSAGAARDLVSELGGPGAWAEAVGSVPLASFTVAKVRWVAEHEPELAARIEHLALPHDWLTARLRSVDGDESGRVTAPLVTDRGDASGTGYWSPAENRYRDDLVVRALGRQARTPEVLGPHEAAGETPDGMLVGAGTGDNMGAALGLGAGSGDVIVSLGTSGTVFAVHDAPTADATGAVAGFADATGRYLPLVCTFNAARVLTSAAAMLGTDLARLERLAGEAEPGAGGLVLLPYLDGERTPDLPHATGTLSGLTRANMTPANLARAAVEGMLCGLADGLDALRDQGVRLRRVVLIGGAARSAIVQHVGAIVLGLPVVVPEPAEYVALGAARQAAWVVRSAAGSIEDSSQAPQWTTASLVELPVGNANDRARVRAAYAAVQDQVHGAELRR